MIGLLLGAGRMLMAPRARALHAALEDPRAAQARVRDRVARALARTEYGRSLGVTSGEDFDVRVPVASWDELAPWIERQRRDEGAVITPERVLLYEKTSGSSGPAKHVPYGPTLRRTFSRMFTAWAHDLLAHGPKLETGRFYFAVSPALAPREVTAHGVPVGTEDDRDYLDGWLRPLLAPFVVGPPGLGRERDAERFRRRLAEALVAAEDLEIVSVWSPSFLTSMIEHIQAKARELPLSASRRAAVEAGAWREVWPRLKLISCWDSAGAAPLAARVRASFPGLLVQGKGLLATEGPVTIPLVGAPAGVPLADDVLIELEQDDGRIVALAEAVEGASYAVIISPLGGLPRYRLGDRVRARGHTGATPCLELLGRGSATSDLAGEKLSEPFVVEALAKLDLPLDARAALVPVRSPRDHYVLVIDGAIDSASLAERLESRLAEAHHYRQARLLGQLGAARVVARPGADGWLTAHQLRRGLKWGDIKPSALVTTPADDALVELLA